MLLPGCCPGRPYRNFSITTTLQPSTWDFPQLKLLRTYDLTSSLCSCFFMSIAFYKLACFGNSWPKRHPVHQTISYSSVYSSALDLVLDFSVTFLKALKTYSFKQLLRLSDGRFLCVFYSLGSFPWFVRSCQVLPSTNQDLETCASKSDDSWWAS